jgi:hypothetical protein
VLFELTARPRASLQRLKRRFVQSCAKDQ